MEISGATLSATPRIDSRPNQPPASHQYGTRIRQNSIIKPSARLRQSPDPLPPRKLKPVPMPKSMSSSLSPTSQHDMLTFPPPHVLLHPEDASNKVLMAIGRSFMSVDNRAMTIKDLAEMTLKYGLMCQNVSAAGQAITTYIRNHMQRCDAQQDHPLLLRHVLSGTPSDDDLLPALHSRSGGAHCAASPDNRATNFRRGTMVWYLSKATGAPCPFQRAGIRLCDYGETGKVVPDADTNDRKKLQDRQFRLERCGDKRKRLLRGYSGRRSDSESSDEGRPPAKVKLTLRLRPFKLSPNDTSSDRSHSAEVIDLSKDSDSDTCPDDSISIDSSDDDEQESKSAETPFSLPPYPRRSISIPCYTPSTESHYPSFHVPRGAPRAYRRSPSVPYSIASPPPDSEEEDDDYHISMTGSRRISADRTRTPASISHDDPDWDLDFDSCGEGEAETQWESPGPRSPSAPLSRGHIDRVIVKQEPGDVQGMLEAWEDMDSGIADAKVVEVVAQAAASITGVDSTSQIKVEELDHWEWSAGYGGGSPEWLSPSLEIEEPYIKEEESEQKTSFMPSFGHLDHELSSPLTPLSPTCSPVSDLIERPKLSFKGMPRRYSELTWKDVELLGPDSIHPREFEEGDWQETKNFETMRVRSHTTSALPTHATINSNLPSNTSNSPPIRLGSIPSRSPSPEVSLPVMSIKPPTIHDVDMVIALVEQEVPPLWSADSATPRQAKHFQPPVDDVVVVHTCQPCTPAVTATQVEGISVYQTTLGASIVMRRIDTDFVNISSIIIYLGISPPPSTALPNSTLISCGSVAICGTWVPLTTAQAFVRGRPLPDGLADIFLSDDLVERFPPALQDFHRSNTPGRLLNQFGVHFQSTIDAKRQSQVLQADGILSDDAATWPRALERRDEVLPIHPHFDFDLTSLRPTPVDLVVAEIPLTPSEQEMFQVLCANPEWDKENPAPVISTCADKAHIDADEHVAEDIVVSESPKPTVIERPLRRSKRVANANATPSAIATRPRTRSSKRGSRNSLS